MADKSQQQVMYQSYSEFFKHDEFQRLTLLDERISRKELILKETREERRKMLMRVIKRARRAKGQA
jgi:hypothetical protein